MKAVNLYFLTRTHEQAGVSRLLGALSGSGDRKIVSPHESATMCALTDRIADFYREGGPGSKDWVSFLDGFFFSYVIEHIGKEFDLLKFSADSSHALNIELKSDKVDEERIRKQLEQNRYYLFHIAQTIDSFTYVMETDELFTMDDSGELRKSDMRELAQAMEKDALRDCLREGIEDCFREDDYLVSPVAYPERFLKGKYFLTNQQFDFRRKVIAYLKKTKKEGGDAPAISIAGIAGTGKTLFLFDLAKELSEEKRVLIIHSGQLRRGHIELDRQLEKIDIVSLSGDVTFSDSILRGYGYVMIDEAEHMKGDLLVRVLAAGKEENAPVILTYDPHLLLTNEEEDAPAGRDELPEVAKRIEQCCSFSLSFTGNIRINRPVYSFLRNLIHLKEHSEGMDYSGIDVLYANDLEEQEILKAYFRNRGYTLVTRPEKEEENDAVPREYDKVIMLLDETYYYDDALHLRVKENEEQALRLLYEGMSRTRENLCLLITGNRELFSYVLSIRNPWHSRHPKEAQ